jgi:hypothetical protein
MHWRAYGNLKTNLGPCVTEITTSEQTEETAPTGIFYFFLNAAAMDDSNWSKNAYPLTWAE